MSPRSDPKAGGEELIPQREHACPKIARLVRLLDDCAVFKVRPRGPLRGFRSRSLKTQQHAATHPEGCAACQTRSTSGTCLAKAGLRYAGPEQDQALQSWSFPRKEVIQPHLPVRLPC